MVHYVHYITSVCTSISALPTKGKIARRFCHTFSSHSLLLIHIHHFEESWLTDSPSLYCSYSRLVVFVEVPKLQLHAANRLNGTTRFVPTDSSSSTIFHALLIIHTPSTTRLIQFYQNSKHLHKHQKHFHHESVSIELPTTSSSLRRGPWS